MKCKDTPASQPNDGPTDRFKHTRLKNMCMQTLTESFQAFVGQFFNFKLCELWTVDTTQVLAPGMGPTISPPHLVRVSCAAQWGTKQRDPTSELTDGPLNACSFISFFLFFTNMSSFCFTLTANTSCPQMLMNKHEKPPSCLPYSALLESRRPNVTRRSYSVCDGGFQQNAQKPLCSSVRCLPTLYVIFVFFLKSINKWKKVQCPNLLMSLIKHTLWTLSVFKPSSNSLKYIHFSHFSVHHRLLSPQLSSSPLHLLREHDCVAGTYWIV